MTESVLFRGVASMRRSLVYELQSHTSYRQMSPSESVLGTVLVTFSKLSFPATLAKKTFQLFIFYRIPPLLREITPEDGISLLFVTLVTEELANNTGLHSALETMASNAFMLSRLVRMLHQPDHAGQNTYWGKESIKVIQVAKESLDKNLKCQRNTTHTLGYLRLLQLNTDVLNECKNYTNFSCFFKNRGRGGRWLSFS